MKLLKNNESGQALIMAVILLALGSLLVVPALTLTNTSLNYHRSVERNTLELHAADAGVQYALCKLLDNPGAFGPEPLPSAVNNRTVNITVENLGNSIYKITSTAISDSGSSTSIESYMEAKRGPFGNAITVINGDLILQGTTVDGDVYASGEVTLEQSVVTGTVTAHGTEEFDLLDTGPYKTEAQTGGTINGNLVLGVGTHNLGPKYITGYLKIQEGAQVTMDGAVYVGGLEKMAENLTIHIEAGAMLTGTADFIAEDGNIKIELSRFEFDNIPLVAAVAGTIKVENCTYIQALLYAPDVTVSSIKVEENIEIYGSIFTANLSIVENSIITYPSDTEEDDLLGDIVLNCFTWQISR